MLDKLNSILNIMIGSFIGVFLGHGLFVIYDFKTHPDLYAMQSAPWYTSIALYGAVTAAFLIAAVLMKQVIRKNRRQA